MQRSFSSFVEARLQKWASQEIIEHMEHVKQQNNQNFKRKSLLVILVI